MHCWRFIGSGESNPCEDSQLSIWVFLLFFLFNFSLVYSEARPSSRKFYLCAKKCLLQNFQQETNGNNFLYGGHREGKEKVLHICCHLCPSLKVFYEKKWQQKNKSRVMFPYKSFAYFFFNKKFSNCIFRVCRRISVRFWSTILSKKWKSFFYETLQKMHT